MSEKSIKYEEALELLKYKSTEWDGEQILKELVSNGDVDAMIALAEVQGIDFYEMAANLGDARGQYAMGKYFARRSVQEFKKSAEFLEKAAMQGHDDAMDLLGFLLMEERGKGENRLEKDTKKGIEWLKKAAEQGNKSALYRLGQCYESGNGVEKDSEEALRLFKSSADAGEVRAIDWFNKDVYQQIDTLLEKAKEKEICYGNIETGEGKALYQEMTRAVQGLYGFKAPDSEFEIWKDVINYKAVGRYGKSDFLYYYAFEVIITLLKKQNIDADQYTRRRLLDGFDIEKLKDIGNKLWHDKNDQKMAVYFYEYIIRKGMATEEDLNLIERAIRYCVNNNEKEKAFFFGNYVIEKFHTSKKLALSNGIYKEILGWMCCRNNGYFLTDDRPDENGQYTDHGRIVNEAFYASAFFDGVLE